MIEDDVARVITYNAVGKTPAMATPRGGQARQYIRLLAGLLAFVSSQDHWPRNDCEAFDSRTLG